MIAAEASGAAAVEAVVGSEAAASAADDEVVAAEDAAELTVASAAIPSRSHASATRSGTS